MLFRYLRSLNTRSSKQLLSNNVTRTDLAIVKAFQNLRLIPFLSQRLVSTSAPRSLATTPYRLNQDSLEGEESDEEVDETNSEEEFLAKYLDPKDRTRKIPVEVSMKYMESVAFKKAYGDEPLWVKYRRNHKRQFAPQTRETCIRQGRISTGSPCPICRDEYLVLDYRNVKLLQHFIDPYTGQTLPTSKTNICQKQFRLLDIEVERAKDHGLIEVDVPQVEYDYELYKKQG